MSVLICFCYITFHLNSFNINIYEGYKVFNNLHKGLGGMNGPLNSCTKLKGVIISSLSYKSNPS